MKKRYLVLTICIFALALLGSVPAGASTLIFTNLGLANEVGNTFLVSSGAVNYSSTVSGKTISGTITEDVYKETATNNLDFVYQITNNGNDPGGITTASLSDFSAGGSMFLDYQDSTTVFCPAGACTPTPALADAAGVNYNPISATGGSTINVGFGTPPGGAGLGATAASTSAILVITTTAKAYQAGTVSLLDSAPAGPFMGFFAPAAVPEPRFYGIMLAGLVMLFAALKKVGAKQTA